MNDNDDKFLSLKFDKYMSWAMRHMHRDISKSVSHKVVYEIELNMYRVIINRHMEIRQDKENI